MKQKLLFALGTVLAFLVFNFAQAQLMMPGSGGSTSTPDSIATSTPCGLNASSTPCGLQMPGGGLLMEDITPALQPGPRLIRVDPNSKIVYYVSADGIKLAMWTASVFNSYHNKWEDVENVSQEEFDQYPDAEYIKLVNNARVYKIEAKIKRYITPAAATELGIDPAWVMEVNRTEFNYYRAGANINTADDIQQ